MSSRIPFAYTALLGVLALSIAVPASARSKIRLRDGGASDDTIVIDETSNPPKITASAGVAVSGPPGSLRDLGGGQYEILVPGQDVTYHLKTRGGEDSVTVIDGPGSSTYWLGVGSEGDSVVVYDGPGNDRYKVEGKGGDDVYLISDDSGTGEDYYYVKGARGADQIDITDGEGNDFYKVKARSEASLAYNDAVTGDVDVMKLKGVSLPLP